jgi:hypothetical protein
MELEVLRKRGGRGGRLGVVVGRNEVVDGDCGEKDLALAIS